MDGRYVVFARWIEAEPVGAAVDGRQAVHEAPDGARDVFPQSNQLLGLIQRQAPKVDLDYLIRLVLEVGEFERGSLGGNLLRPDRYRTAAGE